MAGSDFHVRCSGSGILERMLCSADALGFQITKRNYTGVAPSRWRSTDAQPCAGGLISSCQRGVCAQSTISPSEETSQVWMLNGAKHWLHSKDL